jgi:hypothetical protein
MQQQKKCNRIKSHQSVEHNGKGFQITHIKKKITIHIHRKLERSVKFPNSIVITNE